jgi:pteridine reductase
MSRGPAEPQTPSPRVRPDRPLAIITGAARRVGLAIARELAAAGCDLVITYRTSRDEAHRAAEELRVTGASVRLEQVDLADLAAAETLTQRLATELPRIDILIHNASIYDATPLTSIDARDLLSHFTINAASHALLSARLAPRLAESPLPAGGAIVAMCDIHAMGRPRREFLAYSMSKAALAEMVYSLARELAPRVRVNGIAPGVVAFADHGPDADPKLQQAYLSRVPLKRSGTPEDAAKVVRWLALDAAYTTGEIVRVDGGRWLA